MYKLLIVDDEPLIIRRIKKLIWWDRLNIGKFFSTTDGDEAVLICERERPEIVLTDINMPIVTGLEIIERVSSMPHVTEFLIISGFDDFQFARQAMRFGVRSYLLKPVDETELNEALEQAIHSYENKNQMKNNQTLFKQLNIKNELKIPGSNNAIVNKMIAVIKKDYAQPLTIKDLSDKMNINPIYAGQLFKKETNLLFNDYLSIIRIRKAMEQLANSNRIIVDISENVGYQDTSQFYKVFKKITGLSPSEFRAMLPSKQ
jgi:two-component system response regulator YesN